MRMDKLTDAERLLRRRIRRALQADRSRIIKKGRPFGRVRVERFDTAPDELYHTDPKMAAQSERTGYLHSTKGRVDRRTTIPLLNNLIAIG